MNFPKLIVFDFHGCLSLNSGTEKGILLKDFEKTLELPEIYNVKINNIKNALRKYKDGDWYSAMIKIKINPYIMMPTLDDVISFVKYIQNKNQGTVFSIASMLEDEQFMYDMMKYCFESKGNQNPFLREAIVSSHSLKGVNISKSNYDKWPHIFVILKRLNLPIQKSNIVLIDDSQENVLYMTLNGICSILVEDYFKMTDWNNGCYTIDY